jgi:uncharacterized membrane protein
MCQQVYNIISFIVAFIWGALLQFVIDLFRGIDMSEISTQPHILGICLGGFIFAVLLTLGKYIKERRKAKK